MEKLNRKETLGKSMVYGIVCLATGDCYVGASQDGYNRVQNHTSFLKHGKHTNGNLQDLWNQYGEDNFKAYIVKMMPEGCSREELLKEEEIWIGKAGNLNIQRELGEQGYKQSTEAKSKIKRSLTEKWKNPDFRNKTHGMVGKVHSEETKRLMSESAKNRKKGD